MFFIMLLALGACGVEEEPKDVFEKPSKDYDPLTNQYTSQVSSYDTDRQTDQQKTVEEIQEEFKEDTYTVNDPLVKIDRYDSSPFSALLMFETEELMQVQVTTGAEEG